MATPVSYDDLLMTFEWVSAASPFENSAYVNRASGKIYQETEMEEDLPDDLHDDSLYATVPHKNDFDLGQALVFRFTREHLADAYDQVRDIFGRRGAYGRFRQLLEREGKLEAWYRFEEEATEEALLKWAAENGFEVVRKPGGGS